MYKKMQTIYTYIVWTQGPIIVLSICIVSKLSLEAEFTLIVDQTHIYYLYRIYLKTRLDTIIWMNAIA